MTDDPKYAANRAARDEKKAAYLRGIYDRYTKEFRAVGNEGAPAIAREAHIAMDAVLQRDRAKDTGSGGIRCGKGCSHCCSGPVEIWAQEATLLVDHLRAKGMRIDVARLERQSRYSVDTWREQPAADQACVFLGSDGACTVYEVRPNTCRKLLVTSDPQWCDIGCGEYERIERWFSWEAELMESAALEVFGAALMPGSLLAVLQGSDTTSENT